jgi:tRNA A-37 threonylcarbamoyl transferase component Bud32
MNIRHFFQALFPSLQSQSEIEEAYLAEAIDTEDLERRLREIERRGRLEMSLPIEARFVR